MKENKVIQIGSCANQITSTRENPQRYRVYDSDGICPTLNTAQGGGLNPYIIDDLYANRQPRIYKDFSPTLRSERIGLKVIESNN